MPESEQPSLTGADSDQPVAEANASSPPRGPSAEKSSIRDLPWHSLLAQKAGSLADSPDELEPCRFDAALRVSLRLTIGGTSFVIPCGNLRNFELELFTWGFNGMVEFWLTLTDPEETFFKAFTSSELIQVQLSVTLAENPAEPPAAPIAVTGLGMEKWVRELPPGRALGGRHVYRRYRLQFCDPARLTWTQHFPVELRTKASLWELIQAHIPQHVTLTADWRVLSEARPLIFVGLGTGQVQASFYDFILYLVHSLNGVFWYDAATNAYALTGEKPAAGKTQAPDRPTVARLQVRYPPLVRHSIRIANSDAERYGTSDTVNPIGIVGVRKDRLIRTSIAAQSDQAMQEALPHIRARGIEVAADLQRFPMVACTPGTVWRLDQGACPVTPLIQGKELRIHTLLLRARSHQREPLDKNTSDKATFELGMSVTLERKDEAFVQLPSFVPPRYPAYVEGKVVSGGKAGDETFLLMEDNRTGLMTYQVHIPLWNKEISVPADPNGLTGHFFFPTYKDARVLVECALFEAHLVRFLDWGRTVQLPSSTQGNQLRFGLQKENQTTLHQLYVDKKPVFTLQRNLYGDKQSIELKDGTLTIQVIDESTTGGIGMTFDIVPEVEVGKGEAAMQVNTGVSELTAQYGATASALEGGLQATSTELNAAFESASAELTTEIEAAKAALEGQLASFSGRDAELAQARQKTIDDLKKSTENGG